MKIYADFDGCLNSIQFKGSRPHLEEMTGFDDFKNTTLTMGGSKKPIVYSSERNHLLKLIAASNEFIWLTAWVPYISEVQGLTLIKGALPDGVPDEMVTGWKEKIVLDSIKPGEKFVWFDDAAIKRPFIDAHPEALLIKPLINYGLTRENIQTIKEYTK